MKRALQAMTELAAKPDEVMATDKGPAVSVHLVLIRNKRLATSIPYADSMNAINLARETAIAQTLHCRETVAVLLHGASVIGTWEAGVFVKGHKAERLFDVPEQERKAA